MEYGLGQIAIETALRMINVLILVLMEYGLGHTTNAVYLSLHVMS